MISKFLNYYFKIIRLETGYKPSNKYTLLLIFLVSIVSLFFRNYIYSNFTDYPIIISMLNLTIISYIIFIQFNTFNRLILILCKGLPYFYNEIKINNLVSILTYLLGYLMYNTMLLILSVFILQNLYNFIYTFFTYLPNYH